ncbi:TIGR04255 family protein [Dactylosporangium sp. NPDC049742]|uniref:TIGR04255 family protein n=1 Tax=Dactylosporangium sp. NPDC049742 TaxID=3154737 RepID=UPI003448507B
MIEIERDLMENPLVEAILEIRWHLDGNADPAHPLFAGALASAARDLYPVQQRLPGAEIPDDLSPHMVKFRLRAGENAWPLIQAGPGIATLNSVDDYTWQSFKVRALDLWDSLMRAYAPFNNETPPVVNNLILKYINARNLDGLTPQRYLADKLHTQVLLPAGVVEHETDGEPTSVAIAVALPLKRANTTGTVRIQNGAKQDAPAALWELTADGKFPTPVDRAGFEDWLEYSHGVLEAWFFSLIQGDLLTAFRGV